MKRIFEKEGEEDGGSFVPPSKRPLSLFATAMREVTGAQCMQKHVLKLEPFIRRVVQEEVQNALCRYVHSVPRLPINQIQASVSRRYRLHFQNSLPHKLFTGSRIETEGRVPVQIVLMETDLNTNLNKIVTSGPLSSIKIEILVLDGDFGGDGQEEWTEKDFGDSVIREREGKRPLLHGDLDITLRNGLGYLGDVAFTDNSSWIRSRKFRLGARVCQSRCTEERVQGAITGAFLVKDHRGELYKKHHPPSLNDDVWRLEKIGKDGAFHRRLAENEIKTVQDFLKNLVIDPDRLRRLLGNGMSHKIWEVTLEHARECVLDEKRYSYCGGQGLVLMFNSIFQLVGAIFDHTFHLLDDLTPSQKIIVNELKQLAYRNPNDILEVNLPLVDTLHSPLPTIAISVPGSSWSEPQLPDLPVPHHDDSSTPMGFLHQSHPPSNDPSQLKDIYTGQGFHPILRFGSFQTSSLNNRDFIDMQFGDIQTGEFMTREHLMGYNSEADMLISSPLPMLWDHENGLIQTSGGEPSGSFVHRMPGIDARIPSGKWVKLVAAIKWMAMSKRLAARRAGVAELGYPTLASSSSSICADAHGGW